MSWRRCSRLPLLLVLALAACGDGAASSEAKVPAVAIPPIVEATPVVPVIDAAMKAHLRAVFERGRSLGRRPDVFAKIGDSNTAIPDFLVPVGCGEVIYGRWAALLEPVVARWSATSVPRGWELERCAASNSFTRVGSAAFPGWRSKDLLRAATPHPADCQPPDDVAIRCEVAQLQPSVALLMIGTNDMLLDDESIDPSGLEHFVPRLRQIITELESQGVVVVVSTLPPRRHPSRAAEPLPPVWNASIIEVARELQVPVWNFWLDLQDASQFGMSYDWLHPSPAPTGAGDLRDAAMDWGFNVRNLGALQVLEKVGRIVIDDGAPDPG